MNEFTDVDRGRDRLGSKRNSRIDVYRSARWKEEYVNAVQVNNEYDNEMEGVGGGLLMEPLHLKWWA